MRSPGRRIWRRVSGVAARTVAETGVARQGADLAEDLARAEGEVAAAGPHVGGKGGEDHRAGEAGGAAPDVGRDVRARVRTLGGGHVRAPAHLRPLLALAGEHDLRRAVHHEVRGIAVFALAQDEVARLVAHEMDVAAYLLDDLEPRLLRDAREERLLRRGGPAPPGP